MKFPVALQLYSVRKDMKEDFEGTLQKVKALGYDGVEFAGLFNKTAAEIKEVCQKIDIQPVSAHIPFVDMINNPDLLNIYAEIGCKYIVIPYLTEDYRPGKNKFTEVIEGARLLGEKAKLLGMQLAYHNHDFEFVKLNSEYALDVLYKEVPADILQTELDTCWVSVGGEDPSAYIKKYANRCDLLHLKDYVGSKSKNMYNLIGLKENNKTKTEGNFEFRPIGSGVLNFPEILAAAEKSNVKWIIVEQDKPSMDKTSLECAEMSIKYLKSNFKDSIK